MPGILGLVTRLPQRDAEPLFRAMIATLRHEPFYEVRSWTDPAAGVYVGWSSRSGSAGPAMPATTADGNVTLVFSGEDFSASGSPQDGASDLLESAATDSRFPRNLNGRFHGILVDRRTRTSTLFIDRFGMHRLYYHESPQTLTFAAEAKAILAANPDARQLDFQSVGELLSCGCVLENRSLFRGVRLMPPASKWTVGPSQAVAKSTYFEPREWEEQEPLTAPDYYRALRDVFAERVPRYFAGPERVGMSMTGGLDTRMVMAWTRAEPSSLPCYTFGGMYRDSQDVVISRQVADVCGQPHEVIPVGGDFLSAFERYAERSVYLTDGTVDVSRAPDLYVNERARQIAPIRMTGLYGGEVMRRVRAFKPVAPMPGLFDAEVARNVDAAKESYARVVQGHPLSFAVFRQGPWHYFGSLALEQTQVGMRSPFLDNEFVRTVFRAPASACTSDEVSLRLIADGRPQLASIRTDRGIRRTGPRLGRSISRAVLEFLFKAEYAYDYGMPQRLAQVDGALSALRLERLFLGRHKFYHFRVWYRDRLANYVRDMLLDPRTLARPYLRREAVEAVVNGHLSGRANYTREIHKLLTLELVSRLFIDSSRATAH